MDSLYRLCSLRCLCSSSLNSTQIFSIIVSICHLDNCEDLDETLNFWVLRMKLWGCFLVIFGSISFIGFVFAALVSKLFPLSDNSIIQAIQNDWYYCFLIPLTLPALLVAIYFHWLSMKLFKHA